MVLLLWGLVISARPAARRVRRAWFHWSASSHWNRCRDLPATDRSGEPYAWVNVPVAGLNALVLNTADGKNLGKAPCRVVAKDGPTVILGHRDTHFQGLEKLRPGDRIELELRRGERRRFRIYKTEIVSPFRAAELAQQGNPHELVLLTCYPFRYIGPAPLRYLVWAEAT